MEEQYNKKGGPRTKTGRATSAKNSLKHGMTSSQIVLPGEDAEAFESLVDQFEKDFNPESAVEVVLVHNMAKFQWLVNRAIRLQQRAFEDPENIDTKFLELMMRYQNANHRAFTNTLRSLQIEQRERERAFNQFVPEDLGGPYYSTGEPDCPHRDSNGNPPPKPGEGDKEPAREFIRPPGKLA
jgi:hypothetical protein